MYKQTYEMSIDSENFYRHFVEFSSDAIFIEQDKALCYANAAGLNLLELYSADLTKHSLSDFLPQQENPIARFINIDKESYQFLDEKLYTASGKSLNVEITIVKIVYQKKAALQIVIRDITEREKQKSKIQRMALSRMAATMAHEIRNPLTAIGINCYQLAFLLSGFENYQEILNNLRSGVARIEKVIEQIVGFTCPLQIELKKGNIIDVLASAISLLEDKLAKANITIIKNYHQVQEYILMDFTFLVQAFNNILVNAKQAMVSGGKLTITVPRLKNVVTVEIKDTGRGIARENINKIYEPFFTTKSDGIGLGLHIALQIFEVHQAQLAVESEVDIGTKFIICFPRVKTLA